MSTQFKRAAEAKRHFVTDETIEFKDLLGVHHSFRLRIWQGAANTPIVLVSQLPGNRPPSWMTSKIANRVFKFHLGYPAAGMYYYEMEAGDDTGTGIVWMYDFEEFGNHDRATLFRPTRVGLPGIFASPCDDQPVGF